MGEYLLISDAAKEVSVESHVLRYWEEELHLPIKRNELGHRYYTKEDVERFRQIKAMKERGLQLKAIKMILKDGKLDLLTDENYDTQNMQNTPNMQDSLNVQNIINTQNSQNASKNEKQMVSPDIIQNLRNDILQNNIHADMQDKFVPADNMETPETREEKARRLQWLLQQLIRDTLVENNKELCREIKENIVKELDYQFRSQEEREEERDKRQMERDEEYYKKMDELLRSKHVRTEKGKKSGKDHINRQRDKEINIEAIREKNKGKLKESDIDTYEKLDITMDEPETVKTTGKKEKKKRHLIF
jgi:DNA-binding transcriptional MerR regulator